MAGSLVSRGAREGSVFEKIGAPDPEGREELQGSRQELGAVLISLKICS
jgi:hypothetical protein